MINDLALARAPSLTPPQTQVLLAAVGRPDARVWPLPETLTVKGAALQRVLQALLKTALVAEVAAHAKDHVWRTDGAGHALTLSATSAARSTLGLPAPEPRKTEPPRKNSPGGKLGQVLTALESPAGVTIDALVILTGWLPHTTRAALTRLRQRGHPIVRERSDAGSIYRIETSFGVRAGEDLQHGV